jgi:anaerobic selenocysteine-containing dehydrogenase
MDDFYPVRVGGDVAFLNGVMKRLVERDWLDRRPKNGVVEGFLSNQAGCVRIPDR